MADDARILDAEVLPDALVQAVQRVNRNFRLGHSRTAGFSYWANHCGHYGALKGDFFLDSAPDGPFFGGQIPDESSTVALYEAGEWKADTDYGY